MCISNYFRSLFEFFHARLSRSIHWLPYVNICLLIAHSVLGSFPVVGLDYFLLLTNWTAGYLDDIQGPLFWPAVCNKLESEWLLPSLKLTKQTVPSCSNSAVQAITNSIFKWLTEKIHLNYTRVCRFNCLAFCFPPSPTLSWVTEWHKSQR